MKVVEEMGYTSLLNQNQHPCSLRCSKYCSQAGIARQEPAREAARWCPVTGVALPGSCGGFAAAHQHAPIPANLFPGEMEIRVNPPRSFH